MNVRCGLLLIAGALLLAVTSPVHAEYARVTLKDGRVLVGDVAEQDAVLLIRTSDGHFRIPKAEVAEVDPVAVARDFVSIYQQRFQALPKQDVSAHFALAVWLYEQQQYALVERQCNYVLTLDPDHHEAKMLRGLAAKRLRDAEVEAAESDAEDGIFVPLLGPEDINRLKFYELGDPPPAGEDDPRMRFRQARTRNRVEEQIRTALEETAESPVDALRQYRRGSASEKLRILVENTQAQFADRITVVGDPQPVRQFRRRVMPLLLQGCMTSACHGGESTDYKLPRASLTRDDVVYTTLLLLLETTVNGRPLINREQPDRSVLIDFMLRDRSGRLDHPLVDGEPIDPLITQVGDRRYEVVYRFAQSLFDEQPDYDLAYDVPPLDFTLDSASSDLDQTPDEGATPTPPGNTPEAQ